MSEERAVAVGGVEYAILAKVGEWDYSWQIGALLRGPDDRLYFVVDGGGSCSSFGESLDPYDLRPVASPHEAVELSKADFSDADVCEFARRLLFPARPV